MQFLTTPLKPLTIIKINQNKTRYFNKDTYNPTRYTQSGIKSNHPQKPFENFKLTVGPKMTFQHPYKTATLHLCLRTVNKSENKNQNYIVKTPNKDRENLDTMLL